MSNHHVLPDIIAKNLTLLICGYNPGRKSAATNHYFASPGHRFWETLHWSGFTDRRLTSCEDKKLLDYGIGLTDLLKYSRHGDMARAMPADRERLEKLVKKYRPGVLAFLGKRPGSEYTGRVRRSVEWGFMGDRIGPTIVATMPDPSGANAHFMRLRYHWRDLCCACNTNATPGR